MDFYFWNLTVALWQFITSTNFLNEIHMSTMLWIVLWVIKAHNVWNQARKTSLLMRLWEVPLEQGIPSSSHRVGISVHWVLMSAEPSKHWNITGISLVYVEEGKPWPIRWEIMTVYKLVPSFIHHKAWTCDCNETIGGGGTLNWIQTEFNRQLANAAL